MEAKEDRVDNSSLIAEVFKNEESSVGGGHTFEEIENLVVESITVPVEQIGNGQLKKVLDEYGVAIVSGLASEEECIRLEADFGRDLAGLLDMEKIGSSSFKSLFEGKEEQQDQLYCNLVRNWPTSSKVGQGAFAGDFGLPHGKFAWEVRLNSNIQKVYTELHNCQESELCVGLDQIFFSPPTKPLNSHSRTLWPHVDQNSSVDPSGGWPVYQSILYVWGSDLDGATTTVVWPKSHTSIFEQIMADKYFKERGKKDDDHYSPFSQMENRESAASLDALFLEKGKRIRMPRGGLLVWNSRSVHQGHGGGRRLAMPVCWEPRDRRPEEVVRRKGRLCVMGLPTTHLASFGCQHGLSNLNPAPVEGKEFSDWVSSFVAKAEKEKEGEMGGPPNENPQESGPVLPFRHRISSYFPISEEKREEFEELEKEVWGYVLNGRGVGVIDSDPELGRRLLGVLESRVRELL